jgi:hypothetical protein
MLFFDDINSNNNSLNNSKNKNLNQNNSNISKLSHCNNYE